MCILDSCLCSQAPNAHFDFLVGFVEEQLPKDKLLTYKNVMRAEKSFLACARGSPKMFQLFHDKFLHLNGNSDWPYALEAALGAGRSENVQLLLARDDQYSRNARKGQKLADDCHMLLKFLPIAYRGSSPACLRQLCDKILMIFEERRVLKLEEKAINETKLPRLEDCCKPENSTAADQQPSRIEIFTDEKQQAASETKQLKDSKDNNECGKRNPDCDGFCFLFLVSCFLDARMNGNTLRTQHCSMITISLLSTRFLPSFSVPYF